MEKLFFKFFLNFFFEKFFVGKYFSTNFVFGDNFYYRIFFGENFSFHENISTEICEIMYFAELFIRNFDYCEFFFAILMYGKKL